MSGGWQREGKRSAGRSAGEAEVARRLVPPLGQGQALQRWLAAARRLQLPHAVVVSGATGAGKSTVLQWLTAALLCPSDLDTEGPCGVCRVCTMVANDAHPDAHVVALARDDDDREANKEQKKSFYVISVEQVRHAQEQLAHLPVMGRARVLRIDAADRMHASAQNALLKTLEEPGQHTFLLLEAARPEHLLGTVRSRSQRLPVLPLPQELLRAEILRRLPTAGGVVDRLVGLAGGSLGRALDLHTERMTKLHDLVVGALADPNSLRPFAVAGAVLDGCTERRDQLQAARDFLWLWRAELRARLTALATAANGAYPAELAEPWTSWLEASLHAERDLGLQIPAGQALAACLLRCQAGG